MPSAARRRGVQAGQSSCRCPLLRRQEMLARLLWRLRHDRSPFQTRRGRADSKSARGTKGRRKSSVMRSRSLLARLSPADCVRRAFPRAGSDPGVIRTIAMAPTKHPEAGPPGRSLLDAEAIDRKGKGRCEVCNHCGPERLHDDKAKEINDVFKVTHDTQARERGVGGRRHSRVKSSSTCGSAHS